METGERMKFKCPICRKEVSLNDPYMPFCSAECKARDLGNWAAERYVISTPAAPELSDRQRDPGTPGEE